MNMAKKEAALFKKWRKQRSGYFAPDGVVHEKTYKASKPRLLFILKEVNDPNPETSDWDKDVRKFLARNGRRPTWDNVTRWTMGIRKLPRNIDWKNIDHIDDALRKETLKSIAAMNLKKIPGGNTTNTKKFWPIVQEDAKFIRDQIAIYEAELIVCCGRLVRNALDNIYGRGDIAWEMTTRGIEYAECPSGGTLIAYSHPQARVDSNLLYYGLVDAVREIQGT